MKAGLKRISIAVLIVVGLLVIVFPFWRDFYSNDGIAENIIRNNLAEKGKIKLLAKTNYLMSNILVFELLIGNEAIPAGWNSALKEANPPFDHDGLLLRAKQFTPIDVDDVISIKVTNRDKVNVTAYLIERKSAHPIIIEFTGF